MIRLVPPLAELPTSGDEAERETRLRSINAQLRGGRLVVDSVFDGHRLAREIDSPHPEMPLPFIRERRLWGDSSNSDFRAQLLNTADVAVA